MGIQFVKPADIEAGSHELTPDTREILNCGVAAVDDWTTSETRATGATQSAAAGTPETLIYLLPCLTSGKPSTVRLHASVTSWYSLVTDATCCVAEPQNFAVLSAERSLTSRVQVPGENWLTDRRQILTNQTR